MTYEDGIWESENATKVFEADCKTWYIHTEGTTVANANNDNFTKEPAVDSRQQGNLLPERHMAAGRNGRGSAQTALSGAFMPIPAVKCRRRRMFVLLV